MKNLLHRIHWQLASGGFLFLRPWSAFPPERALPDTEAITNCGPGWPTLSSGCSGQPSSLESSSEQIVVTN